ncbi:MAG: VOC family protein [Euzebyales bacterium]|nr:VOC family protein [Euzebyales bacterium]
MEGLRLNHAVLYVGDVQRSVDFYTGVLGFAVVAREAGGRMAFLRAAGSANHHDLGLFEVGPGASPPPPASTGLYHLAWQVPRITDLAAGREALAGAGALRGASDHGATKSLYAADPDGNEFELMWMVPREHWGAYADAAPVAPLDLEAEITRWADSG